MFEDTLTLNPDLFEPKVSHHNTTQPNTNNYRHPTLQQGVNYSSKETKLGLASDSLSSVRSVGSERRKGEGMEKDSAREGSVIDMTLVASPVKPTRFELISCSLFFCF